MTESADRPPALVALQRDGSVRWSWKGTPRRALVHLWHRDGVIAVFEAGMQVGSQLTLLEGNDGGREIKRIGELGASVQALTAPRPFYEDRQAPPAIVLAALNKSGWSLICRGLGSDTPALRTNISGSGELGNPVGLPVLGDGFVLVAMNLIGQDESTLHLLDVASGREQRVRLPGLQVGRVLPVAISAGPGGAVSTAIALEGQDGISILGNRGTPLR
jgi:hypothetical protein